MAELSNSVGRWRVAALCAALVLLDASLAFKNVWPTPAIRWQGALSVELAVCVLGMAIVQRVSGPLSSRALRWLGVAWVMLVIGRYADVTAPALYGRPINLFWDLRHVSAVAAMLVRVASWWLVILIVAAAVLVPLVLYRVLRWALGRVNDAMTRPNERLVLGLLAAAVIVLFAASRVYEPQRFYDEEGAFASAFPMPVTQSWGRQARLLATELTGRSNATLGASPSMEASLAGVRGADVLLIFIESYGAVSWDRPAFAEPLAPERARFENDIHATGRDVVSAYVESPTFGGNSWLAHISLLSGFEIRDEDANVLLMAQKRDTLVTAFARGGYRTIAMMPGMQQSWPEGVFYGFNEIYDGQRLGYKGPPFGWWTIPDQFTAARLDAAEIDASTRPSTAPVFVFFPTTGTHTPFAPTAPYQPDWPRMLTTHPYAQADLLRSWSQEPDWLNLGPSYVRALAATYTWLGGLLHRRADHDLVMILIGDHQPPAMVSGTGAPWDVPVHVVASRPGVLDSLRTHGFRRGLAPGRPTLAPMHALTPILLDAFSTSGH
jgi:phosphoglycerol transferase MdoB-like AlkP superfamily enzyme